MLSDTDRQALAYEADVVPRWSDPFARLLLTAAPIAARAQVLEVMCGTASLTLPLVDRLEPRGRVVALDPSNALLDLARRKAAHLLGKRVFFRHERTERLSFADDVFDLVVSNAGVLELVEADAALAECVRVAKPGATLAMTQCLRGTFLELLDLFREVLERNERDDAIARLEQHILGYPSDNQAIARFEGLGLRDVSLTRSSFSIEFPSGRACVHSAVVANRFLAAWTEVAGPVDAPRLLGEVAATIDTYFGGEPFVVTVQAACVVGRKDEYALVEADHPAQGEIAEVVVAPSETVPEEIIDVDGAEVQMEGTDEEGEPQPFGALLADFEPPEEQPAFEEGDLEAPFEALLAEASEPEPLPAPFEAMLAEAAGPAARAVEVEPGTFRPMAILEPPAADEETPIRPLPIEPPAGDKPPPPPPTFDQPMVDEAWPMPEPSALRASDPPEVGSGPRPRPEVGSGPRPMPEVGSGPRPRPSAKVDPRTEPPPRPSRSHPLIFRRPAPPPEASALRAPALPEAPHPEPESPKDKK